MDIRSVKDEYPDASNWQDLLEVTDAGVGLTAFIAIHNTKNGPGFGGIRRMPYASKASAVSDALRLSHHMTLKTAIAGLPCGGAKSVICAAPGTNPEAIYNAFGKAAKSLDGQYYCGPDVGTGETEMGWIRKQTTFANPPNNSPSKSTAAGVLAGIRALIAHIDSPKPSTLVQGVGRVGRIVAEGAIKFSTKVSVSDTNPVAVADITETLNVTAVPAELLLNQPCTLFSPCAVGPVVTDSNVTDLPFQWICGSANNQLERPELATVLHQKGILYVPDIVVNAGAVIEGALSILEPGPDLRKNVSAAINAIEQRVTLLLEESKRKNESLLDLALFSTTEFTPIKTI